MRVYIIEIIYKNKKKEDSLYCHSKDAECKNLGNTS